ncbi:MAG: hypothetical protein ACLFOA_01615 [Desulfohalobiaceae bacterium]
MFSDVASRIFLRQIGSPQSVRREEMVCGLCLETVSFYALRTN